MLELHWFNRKSINAARLIGNNVKQTTQIYKNTCYKFLIKHFKLFAQNIDFSSLNPLLI